MICSVHLNVHRCDSVCPELILMISLHSVCSHAEYSDDGGGVLPNAGVYIIKKAYCGQCIRYTIPYPVVRFQVL